MHLLAEPFPHYDFRDYQTYAAIAVFLATWILTWHNWQRLNEPRSVIALLGCALMVCLGVIDTREAFDAFYGETLLTLAGFMVIHWKLEERGALDGLRRVLLAGSPSALGLLARVSIASAVLSALLMVEATTIVAPLVFRVCTENHLDIEPFVLAVATSANIGSLASVVGNTKNLIIREGASSEISFAQFFARLAPSAVVGIVLNTLFLMLYYRKGLSGIPLLPYKASKSDSDPTTIVTQPKLITSSRYDTEEEHAVEELERVDREQEGDDRDDRDSIEDELWNEADNENMPSSHDPQLRPMYADVICSSPEQLPPPINYAWDVPSYGAMDGDPWTISHSTHGRPTRLTRFASPRSNAPLLRLPSALHPSNLRQRLSATRRWASNSAIWRDVFFVITLVGMYTSFLLGGSIGFSTIAAAILLLVIDGKDARSVYERINWNLVLFLIGIFGVVRGFQATPFPDLLWSHYEAAVGESKAKDGVTTDVVLAVMALCVMVTALCLVFNSIPTVLIVAPYIPNMMSQWLRNNACYLLAWNTVVCGNLVATRSSAGIIVSEIAKTHIIRHDVIIPSHQPHEFKMWGRYSVWSTAIISIVGTLIIAYQPT